MTDEERAALERLRLSLLRRGDELQTTVQKLMRERDECFRQSKELYKILSPEP
jgi:hypothetical protein